MQVGRESLRGLRGEQIRVTVEAPRPRGRYVERDAFAGHNGNDRGATTRRDREDRSNRRLGRDRQMMNWIIGPHDDVCASVTRNPHAGWLRGKTRSVQK